MSVIEMLQATPAFALPGVLRNAIKCMSALKSTLTACDAVGWNWNWATRPRFADEFATPVLVSCARAAVRAFAPSVPPMPVIGSPSSELAPRAPLTVGGVVALAKGAPGFKPAGQPAGTHTTVRGIGAPPTVKVENGLKTPLSDGFRLVLSVILSVPGANALASIAAVPAALRNSNPVSCSVD